MTTQPKARIDAGRSQTWLRRRGRPLAVAIPLLAVVAFLLARAGRIQADTPGVSVFPDPSGYFATLSITGSFDTSNPFFQSLGTNGRSCATCHVAANGWTFTPAGAQARFAASGGSDPLFRPVDGSNCPDSPGVSSNPPAASAYSLLLSKGLLHLSIPVPSNAQFTVSVVSDPYGCALTSQNGQQFVSVYRRPLPATNLRFLSAVMFDGRETVKPLNDPSTFAANLETDLEHQALDATLGHAQASTAPSSAILQQIADFELATFTAQQIDNSAGNLGAEGAQGGPGPLSVQTYYPGINDSLGGDPSGATFNADIFTIFAPWASLSGSNPFVAAREAIARGEKLFNSAPMIIENVKGLNDALGRTTIVGTCGTCHDAPNVGDHSFPVPLDIGISDVPSGAADPLRAAQSQLSEPAVPVYALRCSKKLGAPANTTVLTTDPGRALISGACADIGKFKGPILRALASRTPYFQNGAADTLEQVVRFYNVRFQMGLTESQVNDLVAFLNSL
jgi:cytochrome c peroxidase